ncbi:MAG: MBL fold metallo-hydrolase, partial [Actinomycetota bacterium]|nr:MBL fold metallo-hydrolase [Actinomycetota bacterium]
AGGGRTHVLVTRAHPDHLNGLAWVGDDDGLDVWGPPPGHGGDGFRWAAVDGEELALGDAKVAVRPVPHAERVNGYRVEWQGVTVAYLGVHQAPPALDTVAPEVRELASGADLLVHDACLTADEWATQSTSGHSTVDYALLVAREAGVCRLALFGHAPWREDDELDLILGEARAAASCAGVEEVLVAAEGTTVSFERGRP